MTVNIRASADEYLCTLFPRDPDTDLPNSSTE